ncbi:MAG: hypothetical protein ACK4WM_00335, partial [Thermoflexales bacterium]
MTSERFYAESLAYDIAFSDRDFGEECDFLEWCLRTCGGEPAMHERSFLELAAGPARKDPTVPRRGWGSIKMEPSPTTL